MGQTPGGGVPISHNALQHYPEFHGTDTGGGGLPCQVQVGGEGTLLGGYPAGGGGTLLGGVPCRPGQGGGGYPAGGGYPGRVPPPAGYPPPQPGQDRGEGGTQVGQQKEYSIHGGRYASCVHAGGLSCFGIIMNDL